MQGSENAHSVAAGDKICHAVPAQGLEDRRCTITAPRPPDDPGGEIEHPLDAGQATCSGPSPDGQTVKDVGEDVGLN